MPGWETNPLLFRNLWRKPTVGAGVPSRPVEKKENGKNRAVLCTLRWITAEKEELASQDSLIQALAIPYENIYAVNADTCEAVCYRMGQTMNDRYGRKFAAGNYERNISNYIEHDVLKEDRHLFDVVRTISGVNTLLADKKAYYFNYRVFRNAIVQYFQCQLVKPNPERNEFVIAFKNVDEEKKQELAQQKKIAEALAAVEKINEGNPQGSGKKCAHHYHLRLRLGGYRARGPGRRRGCLYQ